jgi:glycosyltransferase involved in cell wall biosynthesis
MTDVRPAIPGPRVALFVRYLDRASTHLANALHERGVALQVVHPAPDDAVLAGLDPGIPRASLVCESRIDLRAVRALRRLLLETSPDIVHVLENKTLSTALLATTGLRSRPRLVAYRGYIGRASRFDPRARLGYLSRRVDRVLCNSRAVESYLRRQGIPDQRLTTIYKGYSLKWNEGASAPSLSSLGVPDGSFVVGCVANVRREKGVDILLRAIEELADRPEIHCVIVGNIKGDVVPRIAESPALRSRVHLLGFRNDVLGLVQQFHVFVMPSRNEALGRALLESMSQGIPPIVSDVGGLPEVVRHDVDGLVFKSTDSAALARAIRDLASDPARRLRYSEAARQRVADAFGMDTTVEQTMRVYRELTTPSSR